MSGLSTGSKSAPNDQEPLNPESKIETPFRSMAEVKPESHAVHGSVVHGQVNVRTVIKIKACATHLM